MIAGLFIYIYLVLGLLVLLFDTQNQPKKQYLSVFNIVYVALVLLAAFSYGVGNDTLKYQLTFQYTPTLSKLDWNYFMIQRSQPLYVLLNSVCKTIFDDFLFLQLLRISLLYHSLYLLLRKLDLRRFWVLFFFFGYCYIIELSANRESLGLAFCFYAMLYYLEKNWRYYYLFVVLGFFFHSGAFIFVFFPLFKHLGKLSFGYIVLIMIVVSLIPYLMQYLQILSLVMNKEDSILRYHLDEDAALKVSSIMIIVVELLIIYFYAVRGNHRNSKGYESDFIYIALFSVILGVISSFLPILYRLRPHFSIFLSFALLKCFEKANKQNIMIVLIFLIFSYSSIRSFWSMMNYPSFYYYCSVFSSNDAKSEMDTYGYQFILNK